MEIEDALSNILQIAEQPFYERLDFWIGLIVGLAGVVFSIMAFWQAKKAKEAAAAAAKTVKIQSLTIELTEIAQRLDKLDYDLDFQSARDLLNEVSRRLRRIIAPFNERDDIAQLKADLIAVIAEAKTALENVRPQSTDGQDALVNNIYFAMQGHFSSISDITADITGLFEKNSIEAI
ncbi:hypothetical protein [Stutzerimonas stutzeri]|uniref:hypothetical protein n=1 Tax=Stutzerimonas stutzeri TaxID=316 RepID=UPI000F774516|nr:hypothetical protein [Stutzerimonas stutzeri]RSH63881.1 hypothetical protein EGV02_18810 [Stutzerimonas stutzeri]